MQLQSLFGVLEMDGYLTSSILALFIQLVSQSSQGWRWKNGGAIRHLRHRSLRMPGIQITPFPSTWNCRLHRLVHSPNPSSPYLFIYAYSTNLETPEKTQIYCWWKSKPGLLLLLLLFEVLPNSTHSFHSRPKKPLQVPKTEPFQTTQRSSFLKYPMR